ncbi:hypothetical protein SDRG_01347 [Saprolegnia diclina VS20]|uniref:C2 domain-containing protein n=1 Tax=Saprolegnia diclina (strain VS20) TaxID=1156394 RepID=T0QT70_SAPDV|nr:hypothetical protein SDRG_01347 [Saprolegnia diclina VS20]EQC41374.1 hypothetical protein SDRG_01347 [Saprolegnia diclina VS20]|eukprot:XP_008605088.1 hypothetical protein SDRG_01347 [Saprolegnia diclina VS20]
MARTDCERNRLHWLEPTTPCRERRAGQAMPTLRVQLHRVSNIPGLCDDERARGPRYCGGQRDPYVVLELDDQEQISAVVPRTLNPAWHASFDFRLCAEVKQKARLRVAVYDYLNADKLLVSTSIALDSVEDEVNVPYRLASHLKVPHAKAYVWLDLAWLPAPTIVLELWEKQRLGSHGRWHAQCLATGDGYPFESMDGYVCGNSLDEATSSSIPSGWRSGDGWRPRDRSRDSGWHYAASFAGPWTAMPEATSVVRRRVWGRTYYPSSVPE